MSTNKIAQLSLLSAACVAGRIAFQFIPNFQPMTAIFLFIVLYLSLKDALIVMSLLLRSAVFILVLDHGSSANGSAILLF